MIFVTVSYELVMSCNLSSEWLRGCVDNAEELSQGHSTCKLVPTAELLFFFFLDKHRVLYLELFLLETLVVMLWEC